MAYAQDLTLINDVQIAASRLGVASRWSSGTPVQVEDDFLFEMHLLFRVLTALEANYSVTYVPGTGSTTHEFPKKPASKAGKPRFNVKDKNNGSRCFQICAGTTARDESGRPRGLDLSIQDANAPDDPDYQHVLQIFDAKYRKNSNDRITHAEFAAFAHWVETFGLRNTPSAGLNLGTLNDLDANCLVTNGRHSTETDNECQRVTIKEIARFYPNVNHQSRP